MPCLTMVGGTGFANIRGAILPSVLQPRLPNSGRGGVGAHRMDYQVLVLQEQTVGELQRLGEEVSSVKRRLLCFVFFSSM